VILIHQLKVRLGQRAQYIQGTSYEHNQKTFSLPLFSSLIFYVTSCLLYIFHT